MKRPHRSDDREGLDKLLKPGDLVMTKRPSIIPYSNEKNVSYLLLKVKAISRSLKSDHIGPEWQVVWFEGLHQPLYYSSLVLVKRGNLEFFDVSHFKPIYCK